MVVTLIALGFTLGMGWIYYIGVVATTGLLVYEHMIIAPDDMSRIDVAFFTVNSYVASVLFLFTLADMWLCT
jgi:4-hydroxybenzoate polyprenyltransferase